MKSTESVEVFKNPLEDYSPDPSWYRIWFHSVSVALKKQRTFQHSLQKGPDSVLIEICCSEKEQIADEDVQRITTGLLYNRSRFP